MTLNLWPFPLARHVYSSAAIVFGREAFGDDRGRWMMWSLRQFQRLADARRWVECRVLPSHQQHVVRTGLAPGYYDEDVRMLHACMALLGSYIDWHGGADVLDGFSAALCDPLSHDENAPDGMQEDQAQRQSEATAIWRWWTVQRPADEARRDLLMHELYGKRRRMSFRPTENPQLSEVVIDPPQGDEIAMRDELWAIEKRIDDDEQSMLHRLITIRQSLWT